MKSLSPYMAVINPKVLKYSGIAIGGIIVFFIFRKQIRKILTPPYDEHAQRKELEQVVVIENNLTISNSDAILIMQNLFNAMNKLFVDDDVIIRNLERLKTKDDLLLIIQKFGIKPYNGTSLTESGFRKLLWSRDLNLTGWIQAELSSWGYRKSRQKVVDIYEKLGVKY